MVFDGFFPMVFDGFQWISMGFRWISMDSPSETSCDPFTAWEKERTRGSRAGDGHRHRQAMTLLLRAAAVVRRRPLAARRGCGALTAAGRGSEALQGRGGLDRWLLIVSF